MTLSAKVKTARVRCRNCHWTGQRIESLELQVERLQQLLTAARNDAIELRRELIATRRQLALVEAEPMPTF